MLLFLLTGDVPLILFLGLPDPLLPDGLGSLGEKELPFLFKAWWVLARVHHRIWSATPRSGSGSRPAAEAVRRPRRL